MLDHFEELRRYFLENGFEIRVDRETERIRFDVESPVAQWRGLAGIGQQGATFFITSQIPFRIPDDLAQNCSTLLDRINSRTGTGEFQLNPQTRFVELTTATRLPDSLDSVPVQCVLRVNIELIDRYLPVILDFVSSSPDLEYALTRVEGRFVYRKPKRRPSRRRLSARRRARNDLN